ncbi:Serine/threonine-protein phosphatase 2A 55 kDa regulatory subunit B [Psidium guajava]|nr:Serine/threonine-protein phosphatase 2A 55 kDa regulatory subunit B [Psidium guajava]
MARDGPMISACPDSIGSAGDDSASRKDFGFQVRRSRSRPSVRAVYPSSIKIRDFMRGKLASSPLIGPCSSEGMWAGHASERR